MPLRETTRLHGPGYRCVCMHASGLAWEWLSFCFSVSGKLAPPSPPRPGGGCSLKICPYQTFPNISPNLPNNNNKSHNFPNTSQLSPNTSNLYYLFTKNEFQPISKHFQIFPNNSLTFPTFLIFTNITKKNNFPQTNHLLQRILKKVGAQALDR